MQHFRTVLWLCAVVALPGLARANLSYQQLSAVADAFEAAIHTVHDTPPAPVSPTPAQCAAFAALFAPEALITSSGTNFTASMFCRLWSLVGVQQHTTTFAYRMVATADVAVSPFPAQGQTVGFLIVDTGITATNCSFMVPNVAWLRVDPTSGLINYLEFVTDDVDPCFG